MKYKLEKALSFYKWTTIIASVLFIMNYLFWGTDDIMFVVIILIVSLLALVYYSAKYLIEIGNDIEEIRRNYK